MYSVLSGNRGNEHVLQIYTREDEKEVDKVRGERSEIERARHSELSGVRAYIHAASQQTGAWALSIDKVSLASGSKEALAEAQKQKASQV